MIPPKLRFEICRFAPRIRGNLYNTIIITLGKLLFSAQQFLFLTLKAVT